MDTPGLPGTTRHSVQIHKSDVPRLLPGSERRHQEDHRSTSMHHRVRGREMRHRHPTLALLRGLS